MTMIVGTKFHFKQAILNFAIRFASKRVFLVENGKESNTIKFCVFELV